MVNELSTELRFATDRAVIVLSEAARDYEVFA
jgi:hypothetical protein